MLSRRLTRFATSGVASAVAASVSVGSSSALMTSSSSVSASANVAARSFSAPSSVLVTARRAQGNVAAAGQNAAALSVEAVWSLWNEGNLFSMNIAQLHAFLQSQNVVFDHNSKKAGLVRQVEELLQARDNQSKGGGQGGQHGGHGNWQQGGQQQAETLMDLKQAGFYDSPLAMAPKAFQLLVGGNTCDLVVARVNTTSFPGFPSSTECYTLTGAVADLALRARYSKALQWCVMNAVNLNLPPGEFSVDFGKMIFKPEVIRKNRRIVSGWTLQQRSQLGEPFTWVSAASAEANLAAFLEKEGFAPAAVKGTPPKYFDCHVRRGQRNDIICLEMDESGKTQAGAMPWYPLQSAHVLHKSGGQDVRMQLRTRIPLTPQELTAVRGLQILKVTEDEVTSALAPEMGQVIYTAENEVTAWERRGDKGILYTLKQIKRTPLIVTKAEDEDPRVEYVLSCGVPQVDLNWFANDLYDLSQRFAEALTPSFIAEFGTEVKPIDLDAE